jgi:N-methylhydantoinase A
MPFDKSSREQIRTLFDEEYKRLYGRTYHETPVEFVTFKVRASLPERPFNIPKLANRKGSLDTCVKGTRQAFSLMQNDFIPFAVYDRSKLFAGAAIEGPAIIEERESTIVIGEDARGKVDDFGFVWIDFYDTY